MILENRELYNQTNTFTLFTKHKILRHKIKQCDWGLIHVIRSYELRIYFSAHLKLNRRSFQIKKHMWLLNHGLERNMTIVSAFVV